VRPDDGRGGALVHAVRLDDLDGLEASSLQVLGELAFG
jgi:hypothetical protein